MGITVDDNPKVSQQVKALDSKQTNQPMNPQAKQIKPNKNPLQIAVSGGTNEMWKCIYYLPSQPLQLTPPKFHPPTPPVLALYANVFQIPLFELHFLPCMPGQEKDRCELQWQSGQVILANPPATQVSLEGWLSPLLSAYPLIFTKL